MSNERTRTKGAPRTKLRAKSEIVTFKAEASLVEALKGVHNRSKFIRDAVLAAMENTCPLCRGSGILTPTQREHWDNFAADHSVEECRKCHELYLVCTHAPSKSAKAEKKHVH